MANAGATTNTDKANGAPAILSLSTMISPYFIGGMMPEEANAVQQNDTIIEIRPFKSGWQAGSVTKAPALDLTGLAMTQNKAPSIMREWGRSLAGQRFAFSNRMARLRV